VLHLTSTAENNDESSPNLKLCNDCNLNISKLNDKGKEGKNQCLIYVENKKSKIINYRKEKN
jgi:protein-arginine kinase activator protein McsA